MDGDDARSTGPRAGPSPAADTEGGTSDAQHDAPEAQSAGTYGPSPTLGARLHFLWFALVAVLWTVPMAVTQFVTHQFDPSARNFKRTARWWAGVILRLGGIRVEVRDPSGLDPGRPYVFVSNHQNLLDILALSAALPYPFGFVAKAELARVPFLGFAIRNSASVFIDRSDPRSALTSLKKAGERIRSGNSVLLFVEGTRSYSDRLQPLKKGAFAIAVEAGVAMVPVAILDAYRRMNEQQRLMDAGTIHIVIEEPIPLDGKTRRDIPELMNATRVSLERALGRDHTSSESN